MHNRLGHRFQRRLDVPNWLEPKSVAGIAYIDKVLAIQPASLIAYWPLREASGTNAENVEGTVARDGTYNSAVEGWPVAPGIGDENTAPDFDGSNDTINIGTASFRAAFDGDEGTVAAWGQFDAGTWTDGNTRHIWRVLNEVTFADFLWIRRTGVNNQIEFLRGDGLNKVVLHVTSGPTDYFHVAMTWSLANDELIGYFNGVPVGTANGLAAFTGPVSANRCFIGSENPAPVAVWLGRGAHVPVWTAPLPAAEILDLATV